MCSVMPVYVCVVGLLCIINSDSKMMDCPQTKNTSYKDMYAHAHMHIPSSWCRAVLIIYVHTRALTWKLILDSEYYSILYLYIVLLLHSLHPLPFISPRSTLLFLQSGCFHLLSFFTSSLPPSPPNTAKKNLCAKMYYLAIWVLSETYFFEPKLKLCRRCL